MWLMNKIENALIQTDFISEIYVPQNRNAISIKLKDGQGCQLGIYKTEQDAKTALKILSEKLDGYILKAPTENDICIKINNTETKKKYSRTTTGQKIRRHGGS